MATTTTVRTQALNLSTSFAQASLVFDDATRLLVGGLWQNAVMESNQTPYLPEYTADIKAVSADLAQQVANGMFTGSALATVKAPQAQAQAQATTPRAATVRPPLATILRGRTITTITALSMCGSTCSH
jgi:hypothetical protein